MQTTEYWLCNDTPLVWRLYGARYWRVPVE